jgi:hypothetical protein
MADSHTEHGPNPEENPAVSYERTDLDIFAVTKFGIGLAIGTVAAVFMMWGLFVWFERTQTPSIEQLPGSIIEARRSLVPPEPRLQTMGKPQSADIERGDLRAPHVELMKFREAEAMQLESYAWADPNKGAVRIPIEVAKDLVLKRGIPSKVTPEGRVNPVTSNPGEGVGTAAAAQPQRVYDTGGAAIDSQPVLKKAVEEEKPDTGEKK